MGISLGFSQMLRWFDLPLFELLRSLWVYRHRSSVRLGTQACGGLRGWCGMFLQTW